MRIPRQNVHPSVTLLSLVALVTGFPLHAQQGQQDQALSRYETGASIILSGTVEEVGKERFTLDYGQSQVTVSLEDWDWDDELQQRLKKGQEVTVSGTVDENWLERRQIDADNIYVNADYAYYYLVDENPAYAAQNRNSDGTFISTRGEVTEVGEDQITLESGGSTIHVDLSELDYDPLDEGSGRQIKEGDRVYVFGDLDEDFYETRTVSAESLVTLSEAGQAGEPEPGVSLPEYQQDRPDVQEPVQQQPPQTGPEQEEPEQQ